MATKLEISATLKEFFQSSYKDAVLQTIRDGKLNYDDEHYKNPDVLSIVEHLEMIVDARKSELTGADLSVLNCFLPSLRNTIRNRKLTMGTTSFVSKLTDFFRYVCIWLNSEKCYHIDVKLVSRRKALESELTKILIKSLEQVSSGNSILSIQPPVIRDRFGLRLTLAEDNPVLLLEVTSIIVSILTNPVSEVCIEFSEWVKNVNHKFGGESVPKVLLNEILSYTFLLGNVKDYVNNPKQSTYQSWQGTLTIDATSPSLGGLMFELQTRTSAMHKNAEHGEASHDKYKEAIILEVKDIFKIADYNGGIVFYEGPEYPDLDEDGLSTPAKILYRHVSPHVVTITSH